MDRGACMVGADVPGGPRTCGVPVGVPVGVPWASHGRGASRTSRPTMGVDRTWGVDMGEAW